MTQKILLRFLLLALALLPGALDLLIFRKRASGFSLTRWTLRAASVVSLVFLGFLAVTHLTFPLHLEVMEGVMLQHFERAAAGAPVYPAPGPEYVPFAYNPLFYYASVPFSWVFGTSLFTLRFVAILGIVATGLLLFHIVRRRTQSTGWAFLAAGLFAAAYKVMDCHLDTAHGDSWTLFCVLLGSHLLDGSPGRGRTIGGLLVLVAAFWFKQNAALFAVSGFAYVVFRQGFGRSLLPGALVAILGPGVFFVLGPRLFGSHFLFFTWEVPRRWQEPTLQGVAWYGRFLLQYYLFLGGLSVFWFAATWHRSRKGTSVWHVQLPTAILVGCLAALDPGSSANNFAFAGLLLILCGVWGASLLETRARSRAVAWGHLLLLASLALFAYDVRKVIVSPRAEECYKEFVDTLKSLDGQVYAPAIAYLGLDYDLHPKAHWAALEDMIRGRGRDTRNHPNTRKLLQSLLEPTRPSYIVANVPLSLYPWMAFLEDYYVLEKDWQGRFEPLRILPVRWDHGWPRYLYRFRGQDPLAPKANPRNDG